MSALRSGSVLGKFCCDFPNASFQKEISIVDIVKLMYALIQQSGAILVLNTYSRRVAKVQSRRILVF